MDGKEGGLLAQEGYELIGAAFEVYNQLGSGFLEEVYQEALELEFRTRDIPYLSKPRLPVTYKEQLLKKYYEADSLVHGEVIVELKAAHGSGRCAGWVAALC